MYEKERLEMLEKENQMLKAELRQTLELLQQYKEKFGDLSYSKQEDKKLDFKKIFNEGKEKLHEKIKDEKVQEKLEKGKKKVIEGSNIAIDAFKTAKKVFFDKKIKEALKEEFENQRKKRQNEEKKD